MTSWNSCLFVSIKHCISVLYRPLSSTVSFFNTFSTALLFLRPHHFSTFTLVGDFNINMNNCRSSNVLKLQEIIHTFSLKQMVTDMTHEGDFSQPKDLVLISNKTDLTDCTVIPTLSNADHNGIFMTFSKK